MLKQQTTPDTHVIIGIDPDVEKSGVAMVEKETRRLECAALTFPQTLDYLHWLSQQQDKVESVRVIIEAGWLNKSNWHLHNKAVTKYKAAAIGVSQGRNEEISHLLGQMCDHYHLDYLFIKPLRKCWSGKDRKITAEELQAITGLMGRTNQEQRDAALIAWLYADLPIRTKRT